MYILSSNGTERGQVLPIIPPITVQITNRNEQYSDGGKRNLMKDGSSM